ncbi:MAG: hypothetical protein ACLT33_13850 [Lachnospira pectinoschiza]
MNDNIKLDDIKEIINQAIVNSERRASRRFFADLRRREARMVMLYSDRGRF